MRVVTPRRALSVALVVAALAGAENLSGQTHRVWAAIGGGGLNDIPPYSGMSQLVYQRGAAHYALRLTDVQPDYERRYKELGLLYGRAGSLSWFAHGSVSAGLALLQPYCEGEATGWDWERCGGPSITVPLVAEGAIRPLPFLGLGVQLFTSVNAEHVDAYGVIFVELGWIPFR